jgi:hypothetical protein
LSRALGKSFMRKIISICTCFFLLLTQPVFALPQITVLGPDPVIPANITTGTATLFTYAIVNNTGHAWPLHLTGFSGSLTRTSVAHDCVSSIPSGPNGICLIAFTATPTNGDIATGINQTLILDYEGRVPNYIGISIPVVAAPPPPSIVPIAVAVGTTFNGASQGPPLVVNSANGGMTFTTQSTTAYASSGSLNFVGCSSGQSAAAACVASGTAFVSGVPQPLVINSTNGGSSFAAATVPGITTNDTINSGTCSGSGASAVCLLGGTASDSGAPYLINSTNGGASYGTPFYNNGSLTPLGVIKSVNCTASTGAGSGICAAVGEDQATALPLILSSDDGGQTFTIIAPTGTDTGILNSVSCSENFCFAVGQDMASGAPLLYSSIDGGLTYVLRTSPGTAGSLNSASCSANGSGLVCIAGGTESVGNSPIIYFTTNTISFASVTITGNAPTGSILSVSCSDAGATGFCAAAGINNTSGTPFLAVSTGGSATFHVVAVPGVTAAGSYTSASCSGTGTTGVCIVGGYFGTSPTSTSNTPLLIVSLDSANTWNLVTVSNVTNGSFKGTGTSNISTFAAELHTHTTKEFHNPREYLQKLMGP